MALNDGASTYTKHLSYLLDNFLPRSLAVKVHPVLRSSRVVGGYNADQRGPVFDVWGWVADIASYATNNTLCTSNKQK